MDFRNWVFGSLGVFEPAKLQNPKIWAKIAIVGVLSINGLLVHYFVLPRIRNQVGKRLLDGLSPFDCSLVLLAGTVSTISWYVPLILGAVPQLNYVVPAEVILSGYALLLVAVNTVIQGAIVLFLRGYSIPVISDRNKISDRSKMNILRGSLALALGSICAFRCSWPGPPIRYGACKLTTNLSLVNRKRGVSSKKVGEVRLVAKR